MHLTRERWGLRTRRPGWALRSRWAGRSAEGVESLLRDAGSHDSGLIILRPTLPRAGDVTFLGPTFPATLLWAIQRPR